MDKTLPKTCEELRDSTSQTDSIESPEVGALDLPFWISYRNGYKEEVWWRSLQETSTQQVTPEKPSGMKSSDTTSSIPLLQDTCETPEQPSDTTDSISLLQRIKLFFVR